MVRASKKSPDEKPRVVLSVLRGEVSASEAACRAGVSEQSVHNWKRIFLESQLVETLTPPASVDLRSKYLCDGVR